MTQDLFMKKIAEVYPDNINSYKQHIEGMLDMNRENIRHREEILELVFSKDVMSDDAATPEVMAVLRKCLDEMPLSDVKATYLEIPPYFYYTYLSELAADNNKHRAFFIKKLRCFEIDENAACDASQMGSGIKLYTEGDDIVFDSEGNNNMKVRFAATDVAD